jgi:formate--tetrahydrofolate ligase
VREVRASVGLDLSAPSAGTFAPGQGLSANPAAARIDIDEEGEILGLQ